MKRAATEQVREEEEEDDDDDDEEEDDSEDEDEDDGDVNPNTEHRTTASSGRLPTTMTIGIPTSGKADKIDIPLVEEMAAIKQEIDNANACLQYALSKDRTSLQNTFEEVQGSSPTLRSVFCTTEEFPIICKKLTEFIRYQQRDYDHIEQFQIHIEKHLRATIQPDHDSDTVKQPGICMDSPVPTDAKSGLLYIQESHWIAMEGLSTKPIGILESVVIENKHRFRPRLNMEVLSPCLKLEKAWSLLQDDTLAPDEFISKLNEVASSMEPETLKSAWHSLQTEFPSRNIDSLGEMALQQFVYPPFARLFKAVGLWYQNWYRAGEDVRSSLSIQCKEKESDPLFQERYIVVKPDGAVIMDNGGWDVLGMMKVQSRTSRSKRAKWIEYDKCVLVTAISALAVKRYIEPDDYYRVVIPFVIAKGGTCSLFATTLDKNGIPCVKVVGYPGGCEAFEQECKTSSCLERKEMFTALAVLLDNFHLFCRYGSQWKQIQSHPPVMAGGVEFLRLSIKSNHSNQSTGSRDTQFGDMSDLSSFYEESALEAAACEGLFVDVAFHSTLCHEISHAGVKNYFFTARPASPSPAWATVLTKNVVFLKVWANEIVKMTEVQSEWKHYKKAWDAGVPVGAPVLPNLATSKTSLGARHVIMAVEYIPKDPIVTAEDAVEFCLSLVDTVDQLHKKAQLLHCDLKPSNVRWSNGVVRLIDFEHAQPINKAQSKIGTVDYVAPEVIDGEKCTPKSDAYGVGRIMQEILGELDEKVKIGREEFNILDEVARKLRKSEPESRWDLQQAFDEIQKIKLRWRMTD